MDIALKESAALILTRSDLSQRGYKSLRNILKTQNVQLPTYDSIQQFVKELNVGNLQRSFCKCPDDVCLSCESNMQDTLQILLNNPYWYEKMSYPSEQNQTEFLMC